MRPYVVYLYYRLPGLPRRRKIPWMIAIWEPPNSERTTRPL